VVLEKGIDNDQQRTKNVTENKTKSINASLILHHQKTEF
jgi:hypothetical protein